MHSIVFIFVGLTLETAVPGNNPSVLKMEEVGIFSGDELVFAPNKKYIENLNYLSDIVNSFEKNKANKTVSDVLTFLIKIVEDNLQKYYIDSKEAVLRELSGFEEAYKHFTAMSAPNFKSHIHFYEKGKVNLQKEKFVHLLDTFMQHILKSSKSSSNKKFAYFFRKVCLRFLDELSIRFKTTIDFSLYTTNVERIKKKICTASMCLGNLMDLLNTDAIPSEKAKSELSMLENASGDIVIYFEELIAGEHETTELSYGLTVSYFTFRTWIGMLVLLSQSIVNAACEETITYGSFILLLSNTVLFNTVENIDVKQYLSCKDVLDNLINGTRTYYILNKLWAVRIKEPKKAAPVDAKRLGSEPQGQLFKESEEENKLNIKEVTQFDRNKLRLIAEYIQIIEEISRITKNYHNLQIVEFVKSVDVSKIKVIAKKDGNVNKYVSTIKVFKFMAAIEVVINISLIAVFLILKIRAGSR